MKQTENHYIDYINDVKKKSLHPKIQKTYNMLPKKRVGKDNIGPREKSPNE